MITQLRLTSPLLKGKGIPGGKVPKRLLQAFRASLDLHLPQPLPPEEKMIELSLGLLDEQPRNAEELLTGLRLKSVRCNEQHVAHLLNLMEGMGFITVDIKASTSEPAYCLTELAVKIYGLTNPKLKIVRLLQKLQRTD